MKKFTQSPLTAAMGALMLTGVSAQAGAESNPFAFTELNGGYMQVAADLNNKVSEGGCGSNNTASAAKPQAKTQAQPHADEHAGHQAKKSDGSCGQGMCGGMMQGGAMKPGMEHSCGAMMKGHEGACGMGMSAHGDHAAQAEPNKPAADAKAGHSNCGSMMKHSQGACGSSVDANTAAGK